MRESMNIDSIIDGIQGRDLARIAVATGVGFRTLCSLKSGKNRNPTYRTFKAVEEYLLRQQAAEDGRA